MPGIVDGLAAPKAAGMFTNDSAILPDDDAIRIGLDLDGAFNGLGRDRVFVPVEGDEAGLDNEAMTA